MEVFNEDYFKTGNYSNYLDRLPRYSRLVRELDELFDDICIRDIAAPVLDYGCAVGFVARALRMRGYRKVTGYDVSEWAVMHGNQLIGRDILTTNHEVVWRPYKFTYALDVFEHINYEEIARLLKRLDTLYLIVRAPLGKGNGNGYVLDVSNADPTHITCLTRDEWCSLLADYGYRKFFDLNLSTIYDTDGVMATVFKCTM